MDEDDDDDDNVDDDDEDDYCDPVVCLTTAIWRFHKPLSQWQRSFQTKAALPLTYWLATASDLSSKTGPRDCMR